MIMKQSMKHSVLLMLALLAAFTASARVHTVDAGSVRGDLTQYLRGLCQSVNRSDTIVLNVGKGEYNINGTIEFRCHAIVRGAGIGQSVLVLNNTRDSGGFKAFTDDAFLKFSGKVEQPLSVAISDLSIRLQDHKGIWWKDGKKIEPKHAVKIYHANRVDVRRVDSRMANAVITNFDLRVCSNVTFTDCIITNYNNCEDGGNLWFRGETRNVTVKHNKFYKFGSDEALSMFSNVVNIRGDIKGNVTRADILVEDNEFYYGYDGKDKTRDMVNNTLVTLESDAANEWATTLRNVRIKDNKFYINDECKRCFLIRLSEKDTHYGIVIEGNQIINKDLRSDKQYYRYDFDINDKSRGMDTISIRGNTVTNHNSVLNSSKSIGYSFIFMQRGNIDISDNKIVSTVTTDRYTGRGTGVQLLWCGEGGGSATMRNNVCKGVMCLATIGAGNGTKQFTLNAFNNYFTGDTRIYCNKIEYLDLNFTGNTIVSNDTHFFLQEFAKRGTLTFCNNDVTVKTGDGRLLNHYSKTSTDAMKFERLEVRGNIFRGVKGEQDVFKKITNVKKRRLSSNRYVR